MKNLIVEVVELWSVFCDMVSHCTSWFSASGGGNLFIFTVSVPVVMDIDIYRYCGIFI